MLTVLTVALVLAPAVLGQYNPQVWDGRSAYVHLFEWKWMDIALECERFLAPKGFAAIQVSPPNEHKIITDPPYPWYQRYQPVSYRLDSRSGTDAQFRDMVRRCNNVGVRIYVDVVINHMAAGTGVGSAGSFYSSDLEQFPGVPYGPSDFTPQSECPNTNGGMDYNNAVQVRNCRLLGMPDLGLYKEHTRNMLLGYLNNLVHIGVAGFRVDASKHMWPAHLRDLLSRVRNLNTTWFAPSSRPFVFHEVIAMGYGEPITADQYTDSGRVTEFRYGLRLSKCILKQWHDNEPQKMAYLRNFGEGWAFINGMVAVTFIDNHDNQRGHGGGGEILTFRRPREYKIANAFMLAHPYGFPQVMSSFDWPQNCHNNNCHQHDDRNNWVGPPSSSPGVTADIAINADGACAGGWRCEHRWRQITNMVGFRNVAGTGGLSNWWTDGAHKIAFGRGTDSASTAFIAINNDDRSDMVDQWLSTGLPAGTYCDVISGDLRADGTCSGKSLVVQPDGRASFTIRHTDSDPIVAIHINAKAT